VWFTKLTILVVLLLIVFLSFRKWVDSQNIDSVYSKLGNFGFGEFEGILLTMKRNADNGALWKMLFFSP
jgi:hypothetical protein